jgi:hypothetical protein
MMVSVPKSSHASKSLFARVIVRENEEMPSQVTAMRDTAVGISAELEQTRQHCHRRLERTVWTSKMDTALSVGLKGLAEVDGNTDGHDAANLTREYELLKSNADRELLNTLLDQERGGDAAIVQALIQAHIETVTIISQITQMDEAQAVEAARKLLTKIIFRFINMKWLLALLPLAAAAPALPNIELGDAPPPGQVRGLLVHLYEAINSHNPGQDSWCQLWRNRLPSGHHELPDQCRQDHHDLDLRLVHCIYRPWYRCHRAAQELPTER